MEIGELKVNRHGKITSQKGISKDTSKDTNIFTNLTNLISSLKPKPYPLSSNKNE